jgi:hypothetical protein
MVVLTRGNTSGAVKSILFVFFGGAFFQQSLSGFVYSRYGNHIPYELKGRRLF